MWSSQPLNDEIMWSGCIRAVFWMCWVFWLCCGSSCYPDTTGSPHQLVRQENELDEVPCEEESTDEESEQDIDIEGFARTEHYTPGQSPHFHVVQDFYQRWMPLMFVVLFFLLFFCCCCFFVCFFFCRTRCSQYRVWVCRCSRVIGRGRHHHWRPAQDAAEYEKVCAFGDCVFQVYFVWEEQCANDD